MTKWLIIFMFLVIFPFAAYAQIDPVAQDSTSMGKWIAQTLGVPIPELKLGQDWAGMPIIGGQYEWNVSLGDMKFQIKDNNENYYRVYYQDNTFTMDFKHDFNGFFGIG
jgi:hypothetical protein